MRGNGGRKRSFIARWSVQNQGNNDENKADKAKHHGSTARKAFRHESLIPYPEGRAGRHPAPPPIPMLWHIALYARGKINRFAHLGGTAYYGRSVAAILAASARSGQPRKACTACPARAIPAGERLRREAI